MIVATNQRFRDYAIVNWIREHIHAQLQVELVEHT